jgi:hypothetical protein
MKNIIISLVFLSSLINIEVADTPSKRAQGLMNRQKWGNIHGMLFIHDSERQVSYWMKNTHLELVMIYLDSDFTPLEIYTPSPLSTKPIISSNNNIKYVLELKPETFVWITNNYEIFTEKIKTAVSDYNK